jgi:hypothetical protein
MAETPLGFSHRGSAHRQRVTRTFQARCPLFSELRQLHPNERNCQTHGAMDRS